MKKKRLNGGLTKKNGGLARFNYPFFCACSFFSNFALNSQMWTG